MFDLEHFADNGVAALPRAFTVDEAVAMQSVIWSDLEQRTPLRRDDPATWPTFARGGISLKPLKGHAVFTPVVANHVLHDAMDRIFGQQRWRSPKRGPRLLITFPAPGRWTLPTAWHSDASSFDRDRDPVPAVQLWALIDRVDPAGGGTLLLAGSHRHIDKYRRDLPAEHRRANGANWRRFMEHYPELDSLRQGGTPERPRREILGQRLDVDGIAVQAIELTGEPGDLYISDLHTFHAASPNTATRPRLMMTAMINPVETAADLLPRPASDEAT